MLRSVLAVLLVSIVAIAGCVETSKGPPQLSRIYGPDRLVSGNTTGVDDPDADANRTYLLGQSLEGRFEGDNGSAWGASAHLVIEPAKVTLPKTDPGPAGGGGEEHKLESATNLTLAVRFTNASKLAGYSARWAVYQPGQAQLDYSPSTPAEDGRKIAVTGPGIYLVLAQIYRGGTLAATTGKAFAAVVDLHWTVESAVRPLRPNDPTGTAPVPPPPNYEEMADKFPFDVNSDLPFLKATTKFRGTYQPGQHGTDVGVEVVSPGGEKQCQDSAASTPPGPGESEETLTRENLEAGEWVARVGAMSCEQFYYYQNAGMVPYTLDLWLYYSGAP